MALPPGQLAYARTIEQARQIAELDARLQSLEASHQIDGAALASTVRIDNAGNVTNIVNEIITETPAQQLKNKHGGKFLRVNPVTGILEWAELTGGLTLKTGTAKLLWGVEGFSSNAVEVNSEFEGAKSFSHEITGFLEEVEHPGNVFFVERLAILKGVTNFRAWSSNKQKVGSFVSIHWAAIG